VGDRPSRCCEQLVARRFQGSQIVVVFTAYAPIDQRVKLEMNKVESAREVDGEIGAVVPGLDPILEAVW
jgi:hypothetical protein